jgi:hypothetical protein
MGMGMSFEGLDTLLRGQSDAKHNDEMSQAQLDGYGLFPKPTTEATPKFRPENSPEAPPEATRVGLYSWAGNLLYGRILGLDNGRILGLRCWSEMLPGYSGWKLAQEQNCKKASE